EMWTFFVELIDIAKPLDNTQEPKVIASIGKVPKKAPVKTFKSESKKMEDDFGFISNGDDDEFNEDEDDDYADDYNSDEYYDDDF
ncbi:MAG: hypothetical protein Q8S44_07885, partial [Flavobacteriaceae bacterium]|nr:hypothetical protein [Flavobacteriaceae bacterium]